MELRHEVLFTQLEAYRKETLDLVEDVSEEEAEVIPSGFNNNIRWNLGHIYLDQYLWIGAVTKEKTTIDPEYNNWFGFGTSPRNFSDNTPSFAELKELLSSQPLKIKERYGDRLTEEMYTTEMGMRTIEQVLVRTIYHEGLHAAAIQYLKRFVK